MWKPRPSRFDPGCQQRCLPTPHRPVSSWASTALSLACHTGALRLWEVLCDHRMDLKYHGCGYTFAPWVKYLSYVLLSRSLDFEMNTCINSPCVKRQSQENAHENMTHPLCKTLESRVRGWGLPLVTCFRKVVRSFFMSVSISRVPRVAWHMSPERQAEVLTLGPVNVTLLETLFFAAVTNLRRCHGGLDWAPVQRLRKIWAQTHRSKAIWQQNKPSITRMVTYH